MFSQNVVDAREVISNNKPDFWDSQSFSQQLISSQASTQQGSMDVYSQQSTQLPLSNDHIHARSNGTGSDYWSQSNPSQTVQERKQINFHTRYLERSPLFKAKANADRNKFLNSTNFKEFLHTSKVRNDDHFERGMNKELNKELMFCLRQLMDELKTTCVSLKESVENEIVVTKDDLVNRLTKTEDSVTTIKDALLGFMSEMKQDIVAALSDDTKLEKVTDLLEQQEVKITSLCETMKENMVSEESGKEYTKEKLNALLEQGHEILMKSAVRRTQNNHVECSVQTESISGELKKASQDKKLPLKRDPVAMDCGCKCKNMVTWQQNNHEQSSACTPMFESSSNSNSCSSKQSCLHWNNPNVGVNELPLHVNKHDKKYYCSKPQLSEGGRLYQTEIKASPVAVVFPQKRRQTYVERKMCDDGFHDSRKIKEDCRREDPSNIFMFEIATSDSEGDEDSSNSTSKYRSEPTQIVCSSKYSSSIKERPTNSNNCKKIQRSIKRYGKIVKSSSGMTRHIKTEVRNDFQTIRKQGGNHGSRKPLVGMVDEKISTRQSIVTKRKLYADKAFSFVDDDKDLKAIAFSLRKRVK